MCQDRVPAVVRRERPVHDQLVGGADLALFVALGGTSVAAVQLSRNSVKSRHIASGQVKTSDIGRSAVTSAKVRNNSLRVIDFAPGSCQQVRRASKGCEPGETPIGGGGLVAICASP